MFNPFRPWRHPLRLLRTLGFVLTALPVAILAFVLIVTLLATSAGLLITFVLAVPFAWILFVRSRAMGHVERSRVDALMDVPIADPVPPLQEKGWLRRLGERVTSGRRWKEIAYHVAHLPVAVIGFALTTAAWYGSIAMAFLPAYVNELPGESAKFYFFEITEGGGAALAALAGIVGLVLIAPWITVGMGQLELALAKALLGPSAEEVHAAQVTQLETSPLGGRRQRRGRAPPHRARPPRRRPAAPRRPGGQPGRGTREARPRRYRGRTHHGGGRPRRGEVGVEGDPRPRARHPPGDPRGSRPRRRAVGGRRPLADPGHARRRGGGAPAGRGRERGVLRRQRGADQRRPPRDGDEGVRQHRPGRRPPRHRGARRRRRRRRAALPGRGGGDSANRAAPASAVCATASPASAARCT